MNRDGKLDRSEHHDQSPRIESERGLSGAEGNALTLILTVLNSRERPDAREFAHTLAPFRVR